MKIISPSEEQSDDEVNEGTHRSSAQHRVHGLVSVNVSLCAA